MPTNEFGSRIRELRKLANKNQREVADEVDIDFTYLSKIESGSMPPPSEKVISKLAKVLNADSDELITLAGKVPSDLSNILRDKEIVQLLRSIRPEDRETLERYLKRKREE